MKKKKPWITYVLIGTLISFVLLDLLIILTGTRILASAIQQAPASPNGAQARDLVCEYFTGTGFETRTFPASAGFISCPLIQ